MIQVVGASGNRADPGRLTTGTVLRSDVATSVTHVERIRSFIAVDIGPDVRAALDAMTRELARTGADARWVRSEGMHATLKFLGGVEATRLQAVHDAVDPVVRGSATMTMKTRGIGAFPSPRRARVVWAGIECAGLAELARRIGLALTPLGFEPEGRTFHPHVTLARVRSGRGGDALAAAIEQHRDDSFGSGGVAAVVLYRSRLQTGGSVYEPLWTIPLAQHK